VRGAEFAAILLVQIIDVGIEGSAADWLRAIKDKNHRQPLGTLNEGRDLWKHLVQALLLLIVLVAQETGDIGDNVALVLPRPDLHGEIRMQPVVIRPKADGVALAQFTLNVGFEESKDGLGDAVGAGFHYGGRLDDE